MKHRICASISCVVNIYCCQRLLLVSMAIARRSLALEVNPKGLSPHIIENMESTLEKRTFQVYVQIIRIHYLFRSLCLKLLPDILHSSRSEALLFPPNSRSTLFFHAPSTAFQSVLRLEQPSTSHSVMTVFNQPYTVQIASFVMPWRQASLF